MDGVNQSLVYYIALKNAGVPVEMHLYAQGGHAFGLRRTELPITEMASVGGDVAGHDRNDSEVIRLCSANVAWAGGAAFDEF